MQGHQIGNDECNACTDGFPKTCATCGELVHGQLDWGAWGSMRMFYHCDGCKLSISLNSTEDVISLDVNIVEEY